MRAFGPGDSDTTGAAFEDEIDLLFDLHEDEEDDNSSKDPIGDE